MKNSRVTLTIVLSSVVKVATAEDTYCCNDRLDLDEKLALFFEEGNAPSNAPVGRWDVSKVQDMSGVFAGAPTFNEPLDGWDVSSVTDMTGMFKGAEAFNQGLQNWDVSRVTNMASMFESGKGFNQDISAWDVSKVTNMNAMFRDAEAFRGSLSGWDVSRVSDMSMMFDGASAFAENLCSWGKKLNTRSTATQNTILVADAFVDTNCQNTADPDLSLSPAGPFCSACGRN